MNVKLHCLALAAGTIPCAALAQAPIETVEVSAKRTAWRGLAVAGATKTDALSKDLPQSVRTLGAELLRDAGITKLSSALELASGIARQSDLGGLWDTYAMRGFTGDPNFGSDYMVNGFAASRGYNGLRDVAGTGSIEILKGPASALYGRGEPGGTVNILTKKPRFTPSYGVEASIGSHATRRVALELTGPLSETLAYRLNAAHQAGDSFRDTLHSERTYLSPSFVWLAGEDTTLSWEVEASRQRAPFDRGIAAVGGRVDALPPSRFLGEPADGSTAVKSTGHQLFVQHRLRDGWSLQGGAAWRDSALRGFSSDAHALLADGRTLQRQRRHRDFSATDRSARIELVGSVQAFGMMHALLAGADTYRFDDMRVQLRRNPSGANPYAIDLFAPAYGTLAAPLAVSIDTVERQRAAAVYAQDQVSFSPRWKALLGVRVDRYRQGVSNHRSGTQSSQRLRATSPRLGLVYQPTDTVSLYASAARGFRPNSGIGIDNTAFPAESSRSSEIGAKYDAPGGLAATLALYRIGKRNVLTTNPVNTDYSLPAGEAASRGLELDVAGELRRGLKLSAAYAYTDARVTRGDNTIRSGSPFPNVARHSGSLLLVAGDIGHPGVSVGAGLAHASARPGDVAASSNFMLPAYTTARLLAAWAPDRHWRLTVNVDNLFDRPYAASSYSQLWIAPGAARSVTAALAYRF